MEDDNASCAAAASFLLLLLLLLLHLLLLVVVSNARVALFLPRLLFSLTLNRFICAFWRKLSMRHLALRMCTCISMEFIFGRILTMFSPLMPIVFAIYVLLVFRMFFM